MPARRNREWWRIAANLNRTTLTGTIRLVLPDIPRWSAETNELWYGQQLVKSYARKPAPNQEKILAAFEEDGWPETGIDNPLPPRFTLKEVIRNLNNSLPGASPISFHSARGTRVLWRRRG